MATPKQKLELNTQIDLQVGGVYKMRRSQKLFAFPLTNGNWSQPENRIISHVNGNINVTILEKHEACVKIATKNGDCGYIYSPPHMHNEWHWKKTSKTVDNPVENILSGLSW
jgi:hypothetical protein